MQTNIPPELLIIYQNFFVKIDFEQIEHVPSEFMQQTIKVQEKCLVVNENYFNYYPQLMKLLNNTSLSCQQRNIAAELLLIVNGENDKAWNTKKQLLFNNKLHDLQRQLSFNGAICLKFKKSTSYYEYRIQLYRRIYKDQKQQIQKIITRQTSLCERILARFIRNYYCWLYRLKLLYLMMEKTEHSDFIVKQQLNSLHGFIEKNLNDHSAYSFLINLVDKFNISKSKELEWASKNLQFCQIAYEHQQQYSNALKYLIYVLYFKYQKKREFKVMGNTAVRAGKSIKQLKQGYKNTQLFYTVKNRKGDRLMQAFAFSTTVSLGATWINNIKENSIQKQYSDYREKVSEQLSNK